MLNKKLIQLRGKVCQNSDYELNIYRKKYLNIILNNLTNGVLLKEGAGLHKMGR